MGRHLQAFLQGGPGGDRDGSGFRWTLLDYHNQHNDVVHQHLDFPVISRFCSPQGVLGDLPADRRVPQSPQHEHVQDDDDDEGDGVAGDEEGELPDRQVELVMVELTV